MMSNDIHADEMYLDLLKRVLTRTLFGSPPIVVSPSSRVTRRLFRYLDRRFLAPRRLMLVREAPELHKLITAGRACPADAETMIGIERLDNLQYCIDAVLREDIPGDLLEAGVWRGGATIFMQAVLSMRCATDRAVWVCDSFAGLPKPNPEFYPADRHDEFWTDRYLAVPVEEVQGNFARYDLLDDNVRFVKGLFRDTLPTLPTKHLAVLRADGDMYESTITILDNLYDKVSPGGFVIIDDYGAVEACRRAVDDFRTKHCVSDPLIQIDWTGYYWRKGQTTGTHGTGAESPPLSVP